MGLPGPGDPSTPPPIVTPPPAARGSLWRRVRLWQICLAVLALGALGVVGFYMMWAATFDIGTLGQMPQRATVYDMDGNPYSRLYGENRIVVPLDKVSKSFLDALVAREDSRFYSHHGVDPRGILRAVVRNFSRGREAEGASTLTQQLARNSLPLGGKTINRKILEAFVAMRIEHNYSKNQILEFYVNRIFYGNGLYGVETASQAYFGKPSAQLDLSESAMMAGLIRSPNRFSPLRNPEGAARERDTVLNRMTELGQITQAQATSARQETIRATGRSRVFNVQENYAMDAIQRELTTLLTEDQTDEGALRIYTTIDPQLQSSATQAMETQLAKIENRPGYEHPRISAHAAGENESAGTDYLQGALVAIDNRDGAIRALVGGREYKPGAFNRALDARRQVGSAFKPFVYTTAWQRGLLPGANIDDGPIRPGEIPEAPGWNPQNSDGTNTGIQPAEIGLIRSRNTMSVRVGQLVGLEDVRKTASAVGLGDIPNQPVVFLGAFEASLKDLTAAYTLFPNDGVEKKPYLIERIDDVDGQTLYRAPHGTQPVLTPGPVWLTTSILEKVMQKGTAAEARSLGFTKPAAGKTGTTNEFKDAWFVGYTTSLTCGVWVGLDRPQTIMAKGYGAALALPIWCQVMGKAPANRYPANELRPSEPLRRVQVCAYSNLLANQGCQGAGTAYAIDLPASIADPMIARQSTCDFHQGLPVNGGPLPPGAPTPAPGTPANPEAFPKRFLRSFRHFFGG